MTSTTNAKAGSAGMGDMNMFIATITNGLLYFNDNHYGMDGDNQEFIPVHEWLWDLKLGCDMANMSFHKQYKVVRENLVIPHFQKLADKAYVHTLGRTESLDLRKKKTSKRSIFVYSNKKKPSRSARRKRRRQQ